MEKKTDPNRPWCKGICTVPIQNWGNLAPVQKGDISCGIDTCCMAFLAAAESDWASLGGWDRGRRDVALQHYSAFTLDLTCETKEDTGKVTSFVERSWATAWSGTVLPFRKPNVYLVFFPG